MKKFIPLVLLLLLISPITAQTKEEKKKLKEEVAQKEYEAAKVLINSGEYLFDANSTITQKGRRIDLTTNSGFLKINKDKAEAGLPYFGVAQIVNITGNGGIEFDNENTEYQIKFNDDKKRIEVSFKAKNGSERFDISLTVFGNNSSLDITSSNRDRISYRGRVTTLKKEK